MAPELKSILKKTSHPPASAPVGDSGSSTDGPADYLAALMAGKPKSSLKKPAIPVAAPEPPADSPRDKLGDTKTRDQRNLEIALYHANLIQAQKDVEARILEALEILIEFPTSAAGVSDDPSPQDVDEFKRLVTPFQPSDYDALLEERRIAKKCGYVFCSNAPSTRGISGAGKLKILGKAKGQEFRVVERAKMNIWCSKECARRALYVKVQLNEEAAWLRRGGVGPEIELLLEKDEDEEIPNSGRDLETQQRMLAEDMKNLAVERGDEGKPDRASGVVKNEIVEKQGVVAPAPPSQDDTGTESRGGIEGYEPKETFVLGRKANGTDGGMEPDWGI